MPRYLIAAALLLAACGTVENETRVQAVVDRGFHAGTPYEIRTRTINGPQGKYEQTSVIYRGLSEDCLRDSPGDCDRKIRALLDNFKERSR